ncbi:hypothetical protein VCR4J5_670015 [Vibrio crassostreae]|uniref:Uncharacterized protein n=1 Tax=Vibrio crassostreae TaxID=246167 RepID=A0ABP1X4R1_9VIBR|nr:hypothetical protein VCR4J5_670015 [Vibrio crassostreae]
MPHQARQLGYQQYKRTLISTYTENGNEKINHWCVRRAG